MRNKLATWLTDELQKRGWSNSEVARRAGLGVSTITMVLNGQSKAGLEFCVKLAEALREPPEKVLRMAGLLPPEPEPSAEEAELLHAFRQLREGERALVVRMVRGATRPPLGPPPKEEPTEEEIARMVAALEKMSQEERLNAMTYVRSRGRLAEQGSGGEEEQGEGED